MHTTCSFVFKDNEFLKDKWREQVLSGSTTRTLVDRIASGGRDGAFRQHIQQWGGDAGAKQVTVSHICLQALYSPSECGAINSIDFDCGVMNIERSTETHFALLLEQNNILFVSRNTITTKEARWSTISLHDLKNSDFQRLTPTDESDPFDKVPNFTFLGNHIRFGYVTINTSHAQDEAVSGIDFWRVTIYHQKGEVAQQNMRMLQLEHNTNVLLQELSDMHEHADKTRREHAAQLTSMHTLQEDLSQERAANVQLRIMVAEQGTALTKTDAASRAAQSEVADLRERIVLMDIEVCKLVQDTAEKTGLAMQDVHRKLEEECTKSDELMKIIVERDTEIARRSNKDERTVAEISRLKAENSNAIGTIANMTADIKFLKVELDRLSELNKTLQQALTDTKASNTRFEELFEMEKKRRREEEQTNYTHNAALKEELRSLSARMDTDIAYERSLRLPMEREHRDEISRVESAMRMERQHVLEQVRTERLSFMQRETELLEEKRNLATSLQAVITKSALTEQRLSTQLLSVSALHKSEVQRIAHLEAELSQERANRELLESQVPREEEDWEVVDQM
jgi:hypothetical protein